MIYEKEYQTLQSYECLNACLVGYLNYLGLKIKGFDLFFGGDGCDISFYEDNGLHIGAPIYEANFNFLDKWGIPYEHKRGLEPEEAMVRLRSAVESEECISIRVTSELLKHSPVFRQTSGAPHYLNILGLDEERKMVYISDGYVPAYHPEIYEGWVELDDIFTGWQSMRFDYIIISKVEWNKREITEYSAESFRKSIQLYLKPGLKNYGISSVIEMLLAVENIYEDCNIRMVAFDMNYQLKTYGFLTVKKFIYECLQYQKKEMKTLLQYEMLLERWNRFCLFLMKAGVSGNLNEFIKLKNSALELTKMEQEILTTAKCES